MKYLTSIVFICAVLGAKAQTKRIFSVGYIIRPDSVLKAGYLEELDSLPSNAMYFKDSINSSPKRFEPNQILGYGFYKGKSYMSFRTSDRVYLFFEKLNDGNLAFYKALSLYLVKKGNNRPIQLPKAGYREALANVVSDCPSTNSKLQHLKLQPKKLRELAATYNECIASGDPQNFKDINYVEIQIAIVGGWTNSTTTFDKNNNYPALTSKKLTNSTPVSGGVQFWFSIPYLSKQLSLRTGVLFAPIRANAVSQVSPIAQVQVSYNKFDMPVAIHFWTDPSKTFYLTSGVVFSAATNLSSTSMTDTQKGSTIYIDNGVPVTSVTLGPQLLIGAGNFFKYKGKSKFLLEMRYVTGQNGFTTSGIPSKINATQSGISITTGYFFR